jgi:hypothetical protein
MRNCTYAGSTFTLWKRQQTWFWSLPDQYGGGGRIGAAASEADAIHEARLSIDELLAQPRNGVATMALAADNGSFAERQVPFPPALVAFGWLAWWVSLASYVTDKVLNEWADGSTRSRACYRC